MIQKEVNIALKKMLCAGSTNGFLHYSDVVIVDETETGNMVYYTARQS